MNAHVLSVHIQNLGVGWEKEQRQDSYPIPSHKPLLSLNAWLKYHLNFFFSKSSVSHKQDCCFFVVKHLYISYVFITSYQPKFIIKILYRAQVSCMGWISFFFFLRHH